ncbi:MAG: HAD family phosphatase [bacterium]|nr:HAD family phosphatase [bacterium]
MASTPSAIVFDLGSVLIDWDPRHMYRKLIDDEAEMDMFLGEIATLRWNAYHDAGRLWSDGVAMLSAIYPEYSEWIAAYIDRWEEMLAGPIEGTVQILKTLKDQGREVHALTNWSAETFPVARQKYEFLGWFEHTVVSGEERIKKPDHRIFEILLKRIGRPAKECVFIDDSAANIAAAEIMGFMTIHFSSPEQLRIDLEALGITV